MITPEELSKLKTGTLISCDSNSMLHFADKRAEDFALVIGNSNFFQIAEVIWLKADERRQIHYSILEHFKVIQNV